MDVHYINFNNLVGLKVLTEVPMKTTIYDITTCSAMKVDRCFEEIYFSIYRFEK
jgi:hypothetical protein